MPTLIVIDRDRDTVDTFRRTFSADGVAVHAARSDENALQMCKELQPDVIFLTLEDTDGPSEPSGRGSSTMELFEEIHRRGPGIPIILLTTGRSSNVAIKGIQRGACDYIVKPVTEQKVQESVDQALRNRHNGDSTSQTNNGAGLAGAPPACNLLVGRSPAIQEVYKAIGQVSSKNVNVLVLGESGTGKELVAQAIQKHSSRLDGPFLTVNCAAIPETLLESELFGHEKGAFTGADRKRIGKFEQCTGGTLFLDEVGDMPPLMQSKLLRVLQEGCFERIGGNQLVETDVRVIAATNRNLEQMVRDGRFRPDLYYRLNIFSIAVPPLRERRSDLPLLIAHFLELHGHALGKPHCQVAPESKELLRRYAWPGNIRELQSALIYAMLHAWGPKLLPEDFPGSIVNSHNSGNPVHFPRRPAALETFIEERLMAKSTSLYAEATDFMERILFATVLNHTGGNQSQAASILGIMRGTLRAKSRALGVSLQHNVEFDTGTFETVPFSNRELVTA